MGVGTLAAAVLGTGLFPNLINWLIPQFGWRAIVLCSNFSSRYTLDPSDNWQQDVSKKIEALMQQ